LTDVVTELTADYTVRPGLSVFVELATTDVTSTDARAEYTRARSVVGVLWRK
jgi:hypothetical protein